jgi:hypothetical protein
MHEQKPQDQKEQRGFDWWPEALNVWDKKAYEFAKRKTHAVLTDFRRFALFVYYLDGGRGRNSATLQTNFDSISRPEIQPVLNKVKEGGHIVSIGGAWGEEAAGMICELTQTYGLTSVKHLTTDIGGGASYGIPDHVSILGYMLAVDPTEIEADPADYGYWRWSKTYLNRKNWQDVRNRCLYSHGSEWDATKETFFENVRSKLNGEDVGLYIMRHPEIGDPDQPKLTEVFNTIILNLLSQAIKTDTPVVITTSTNPNSRANIQNAIIDFFSKQPSEITQRWHWSSGNSFPEMIDWIGTSGRDSLVFVVFPSQHQG